MNTYNYSKLLGRIREKGYTQEGMAKKIGISPCSLNLTLNNKRYFRQSEILELCGILDIQEIEIPEFFFAHNL